MVFSRTFSGAPVMPGVIQIEAMAQAGGILVSEHRSRPGKLPDLFYEIDNTRFKQVVCPAIHSFSGLN